MINKTIDETKRVIREITQSLVLIGLSRSGFFSKASFYGGTALRIFYGLHRYSEGLDFTLNEADADFSLYPYIFKIEEVAKSYGLDLNVETKIKTNKIRIESAFAKMNTYQAFISLKLDKEMTDLIHRDEVIKVKLEVDCSPVVGFNITGKWMNEPEFALINVLDESSLFSGKLAAILCRNYKNTVKGRDYYDFLFYISRNIKPNMIYLKNKLVEAKKIKENDDFNLKILSSMLKEKFEIVDFQQVKNDASRFVFDGEDLSCYCKDLFIQMADRLLI